MGLKLHSSSGLRERGVSGTNACPGGSAAAGDQNGLNLRRAPCDASGAAWSVSMVRTSVPTLYLRVCCQEVTYLRLRPNRTAMALKRRGPAKNDHQANRGLVWGETL